MLFVLTGNVQTGKTRWLEELVRDLENADVTTIGVLAPGVWADRRDNPEAFPSCDANGFEKLGIDNVLLPDGERISFARRADLAMRDEQLDPSSQSARAKLMWAIDDDAIARVNDHFASLQKQASSSSQTVPGMLIIDELGRLELERGEGLTEALGFLEAGPSPLARHALIVVREQLLPHVDKRFQLWGDTTLVRPCEESRALILRTVAESS